jgi:hypothetical protein
MMVNVFSHLFQSGANPRYEFNATSSLVRLESKNIFNCFEKLSYYNAGVVCSCKLRSRRIGSWIKLRVGFPCIVTFVMIISYLMLISRLKMMSCNYIYRYVEVSNYFGITFSRFFVLFFPGKFR